MSKISYGVSQNKMLFGVTWIDTISHLRPQNCFPNDVGSAHHCVFSATEIVILFSFLILIQLPELKDPILILECSSNIIGKNFNKRFTENIRTCSIDH